MSLSGPSQVSAAPVLSAREVAMLREAMARDEVSDISPGGCFEARLEGDSVLLMDRRSGSTRSLPVKDLHPKHVTVSDRGDVALAARAPEAGRDVVGRLRADGTVEVAKKGVGLEHPELSSDGSRLTWLHLYEMEEEGPGGAVVLGKLPYTPDRASFLEDGRLLARSDRDPWGTGCRVPFYWVLDGQAGVNGLTDVGQAESLGVPVRSPLLSVFGRLLPGATKQECEHLLGLFGYRTPTWRGLTPRRDKALFWVEPGAPGEFFGLYRFETGKGSPAAALSEADQAVIGTRQVSSAEWSPDLHRVAVSFGEEPLPRRLAVVDLKGGSRVLPQVPVQGGALSRSPDGRW